MKTREKIKWIGIGLILVITILLCFLIHPFFGAAMAVGIAGVLYIVRIAYKQPVDKLIERVARKYDLQVVRHPFTYNHLKGNYEGHPVRMDFISDWKNEIGLTTSWMTDKTNLVLLDVQNLLRIRMKANAYANKINVLRNSWPMIVHKGGEIVYLIPFDVQAKPTLGLFTHGIKRITEAYDELERAGKYAA
jgi:hypothetical protein